MGSRESKELCACQNALLLALMHLQDSPQTPSVHFLPPLELNTVRLSVNQVPPTLVTPTRRPPASQFRVLECAPTIRELRVRVPLPLTIITRTLRMDATLTKQQPVFKDLTALSAPQNAPESSRTNAPSLLRKTRECTRCAPCRTLLATSTAP